MNFVYGIVLLVVLAIGLFVVNNSLKYPIKILVWEQIGNTYRLAKQDKGRIVEEDGTKKLIGKSKINNIKLESITYDQLKPTHKGGYVLELIKTSMGQYEVLTRRSFDDQVNNFKFKKLEHDVAWWNSLAKREARERYTVKSFMEKYGTALAIGFMGIMLLVSLIFTYDYLGEKLETVANALVSATDRIYGAPVSKVAPPPVQIIEPAANPNQPAPPPNPFK